MDAKLINQTLCWDCKWATGGCRWSDYLKPVKGWTAITRNTKEHSVNYIVQDCPQFIRDAYNNGLKRLDQHEEEINKIKF